MRAYHRHSARVTRSRRWKALRWEALRRDGFACRVCGARRDLEVDHIESVRTHPELSFDLANLQTLCRRHHSAKTRAELGLGRPDPRREAWASAVRDLRRKTIEHERINDA